MKRGYKLIPLILLISILIPGLGGSGFVGSNASMTETILWSTDGEDYDWFGNSVDFDGGTMVVGAKGDDVGGNHNQGSAYVFKRSVGSWGQSGKLTASDGMVGEFFGMDVVINSDVIAIGSPNRSGHGAVYLYVKPPDGWITMTETTSVTAWDAGAAGFGHAVAMSDGLLLVGARYSEVGGNTQQGAAYLFERVGDQWNSLAKFTASDGDTDDFFGADVAISGDTVVVGAHGDDIGSNSGQGSAYVFVKPEGGWVTTTETARLTASDGGEGDNFGRDVSIDDDTLVIGSHSDDIAANMGQGSAYVFIEPEGGWVSGTETTKLTASDGHEFDYFGSSVGIKAGTILIGAYSAQVGMNTNQGAVYPFFGVGSSWSQQPRLVASDGTDNTFYGESVVVDTFTWGIGAGWSDVGTNLQQGKAYIYEMEVQYVFLPVIQNTDQ
jgi:hypothetical protein